MLTDTESISDVRFEDSCSHDAEAQQIPHQPSKGLFGLHH